jgi:transcriptional regulator with XRE-family HTH domain
MARMLAISGPAMSSTAHPALGRLVDAASLMQSSSSKHFSRVVCTVADVKTADMAAANNTSPTLYEEFGRRLRQAREDAGLTQGQLAEAVGLSRTSITNIESGTQPVALHMLFALSRALDKDPHELLPGREATSEFDAIDPRLLDGEDDLVANWARKVLRTGR